MSATVPARQATPHEVVIADELRTAPARLRTLRRPGVRVKAPRRVRAGKKIVVRGMLQKPRGRETVRLAERRGGRWQVRDERRATRHGAFRLRTSAGARARTRTFRLEVDRAGRRTRTRLRVKVVPRGDAPSTPPTAPPASPPNDPAKPPAHPTPHPPDAPAAPLPVPAGDAHDWSWLFSSGGGRWDPCRPIGWGYLPAGGYPGALEDVRTAIEVVAAHTGLTFEHQGTDGDDLDVRWSTAARDRQLAGTVVGYAGASGWKVPGKADVAYSLSNGRVVLDSEGGLSPGFATSGRPTWGQVMIHELLHALGLGHATGREQVMHGAASSRNHRLGAGDLTGMGKIGAANGCLPTWSAARRVAPGMAPAPVDEVLPVGRR